MSEYIAVKGLTNDGGIGIVEIDYSDGLVNFEVVVGGEVIDIVNAKIVDQYNEEEELETGFYWGEWFQNLSEFMRV